MTFNVLFGLMQDLKGKGEVRTSNCEAPEHTGYTSSGLGTTSGPPGEAGEQ